MPPYTRKLYPSETGVMPALNVSKRTFFTHLCHGVRQLRSRKMRQKIQLVSVIQPMMLTAQWNDRERVHANRATIIPLTVVPSRDHVRQLPRPPQADATRLAVMRDQSVVPVTAQRHWVAIRAATIASRRSSNSHLTRK